MQGSRNSLVLRATGAALAGAALLPANALAGLAPADPASPNASDLELAIVVMFVVATLAAIGFLLALFRALRGGRDEQVEPRRTRGTRSIQTRVGLGLGAAAAAVFTFGVVVTESAREVEAPAGGQAVAQAGVDVPGDVQPLEIDVSGQQWLWRFQYPVPEDTEIAQNPGIFSYYELVVPVNTPVVLSVDSVDVVHRWWVPALGGQVDAVPGRENTTWFMAEETGVYEGASTEYSGPAYASMKAEVRVVEQAEYDAWIDQQVADIQAANNEIQDQQEAGGRPGEAGAGETGENAG